MKHKTMFILPAAAIVVTELFKRVPVLNSVYADSVYPCIFRILNASSSLFPFSLYDTAVAAAIIWLLLSPVVIFIKRFRRKYFRITLAAVMWIYVWFYAAWGINYFTPGFCERNNIPASHYDSLAFEHFILEFRDSLNSTYSDSLTFGEFAELEKTIKPGYDLLQKRFDIPDFPKHFRAKTMLYPRIYAACGILGYYGPFFAEVHTNPLVTPCERPFTLAHESAHLLGISGEAEANLYAYLFTSSSNDRAVRFSGYFEIMPYILTEARRIMSQERYSEIYRSINPEIIRMYIEQSEYWASLRMKKAAKIQRTAQDSYLKINRVSRGIADYSGVTSLILSVYENEKGKE